MTIFLSFAILKVISALGTGMIYTPYPLLFNRHNHYKFEISSEILTNFNFVQLGAVYYNKT